MSEKPLPETAGPTANGAAGRSAGMALLRRIPMLLLVVGILAGAGAVSAYWLKNRPKAARRPPQRQAALAEVRRVRPQDAEIVLRTMGTVVPARSIELASRVGGEIVQVSPRFVPGGRFGTGELMVRIDPNDFDLSVLSQRAQVRRAAADATQAAVAITQRQTDLAKAEAALALEMGRQSAAEGEYRLLGETVKPEDVALVLREPQLKQAKADCSASEAAKEAAAAALDAAKATEAASQVALRQAQLDLARTEVRSPFNAMVRSRKADRGAQVAAGASLASLVGTDEYWVQVSVPVDELKWMRIPEFNSKDGSPARVYHAGAWGPGTSRLGAVRRLMSEIEPEGRMARLLVSVQDPLELKASPQARRPLILGSYVRVEIVGRKLSNVVRVERAALRDGNRVWVMAANDTLAIRDVEIAWAGNDHVFVGAGLAAGDRLVVSDLGAPVEGMLLRTAGAAGGGPKHVAKAAKKPADGRSSRD